MKKQVLLAFILITTLTLTGCWNYKEVSDIYMVGGLAIDWNSRSHKYVLTAEIVKPKAGKESAISSEIISFSSESIFDGMRKSISISGKKLYFAHTSIIIISKKIAKKGILPILDIINRGNEFRSNIVLAVSKERTAKEILQKKMKISDASSFELDEVFKAQRNTSTFYKSEMWYFLQDFSNEGISPVLSTIKLSKSNQKIIPEVNGVGVFKKDKLVGYLDGLETKSLIFVRNVLEGGDITLKNISNTKTSVTLEILNSTTKLKPNITSDNINMDIEVKLEIAIPEIEGTYNFLNPEGFKKLKVATNEKIKEQIVETVKKCQNKFDSDVLGFGKSIQKHMPKEWKKLKLKWDKKFKTVQVSVKVDTRIISSYRSYKNIIVGD